MLHNIINNVGGWVVGGWSDRTKVILNSTQFKLTLSLFGVVGGWVGVQSHYHVSPTFVV